MVEVGWRVVVGIVMDCGGRVLRVVEVELDGG